jgi:hypothetical protein
LTQAHAGAYSAAQLKASLWAGASVGTRVHAVLDGGVLPGLPERLQGADTAGWDCLHRGALRAEQAQAAAYVAELNPNAPFTDWLLGEACAAFPGWGLLSVSPRNLLAVREHCRDLGEVALPDGSRRRWRWWDAALLDALLPLLSPGQLDAFLSPEQRWVSPGSAQWVSWQRRDGLAERQVRDRLP